MRSSCSPKSGDAIGTSSSRSSRRRAVTTISPVIVLRFSGFASRVGAAVSCAKAGIAQSAAKAAPAWRIVRADGIRRDMVIFLPRIRPVFVRGL
jgi:hypothetical protein